MYMTPVIYPYDPTTVHVGSGVHGAVSGHFMQWTRKCGRADSKYRSALLEHVVGVRQLAPAPVPLAAVAEEAVAVVV